MPFVHAFSKKSGCRKSAEFEEFEEKKMEIWFSQTKNYFLSWIIFYIFSFITSGRKFSIFITFYDSSPALWTSISYSVNRDWKLYSITYTRSNPFKSMKDISGNISSLRKTREWTSVTTMGSKFETCPRVGLWRCLRFEKCLE